MPRLLVSPLSRLEDAIAAHGPSHLVTLLSPEHMIATPPGFAPDRHLKLAVNDVADPAAGSAPPSREHIDRLLAFSRAWTGEAPLLLHCWAGVSRSMACAFAILCDRLGQHHEIAVARAMRRRAPHAAPNALLVAHADAALDRGGRMIAARNAMGAPLTVEEGITTDFPLEGL